MSTKRKIDVLVVRPSPKNATNFELLTIEDDLQTFYEILECDIIDIVTREIDGLPYDIICDDEGLFKPENLPSHLYEDETIVGNIIITGTGDKDGNLTSLPVPIRELLLDKCKSYRIGVNGEMGHCIDNRQPWWYVRRVMEKDN